MSKQKQRVESEISEAIVESRLPAEYRCPKCWEWHPAAAMIGEASCCLCFDEEWYENERLFGDLTISD